MQWRLRAQVGLAPLRSHDFLPYYIASFTWLVPTVHLLIVLLGARDYENTSKKSKTRRSICSSHLASGKGVLSKRHPIWQGTLNQSISDTHHASGLSFALQIPSTALSFLRLAQWWFILMQCTVQVVTMNGPMCSGKDLVSASCTHLAYEPDPASRRTSIGSTNSWLAEYWRGFLIIGFRTGSILRGQDISVASHPNHSSRPP